MLIQSFKAPNMLIFIIAIMDGSFNHIHIKYLRINKLEFTQSII